MAAVSHLSQVSGELSRIELVLPTYIDNYVLAADDYVVATTPSNCAYALITSTGGVYVAYVACSDEIAEAAADIIDGTGSLYVPAGIGVRVGAGQDIVLISQTGTATVVSVACYTS
jgi:hypothetical protein